MKTLTVNLIRERGEKPKRKRIKRDGGETKAKEGKRKMKKKELEGRRVRGRKKREREKGCDIKREDERKL